MNKSNKIQFVLSNYSLQPERPLVLESIDHKLFLLSLNTYTSSNQPSISGTVSIEMRGNPGLGEALTRSESASVVVSIAQTEHVYSMEHTLPTADAEQASTSPGLLHRMIESGADLNDITTYINANKHCVNELNELSTSQIKNKINFHSEIDVDRLNMTQFTEYPPIVYCIKQSKRYIPIGGKTSNRDAAEVLLKAGANPNFFYNGCPFVILLARQYSTEVRD